MGISARVTTTLALAALVPFAIYAGLSGELTTVTAVIGALNLVIIAVSLIVLFGPTPTAVADSGNGATH